jgi:hypothetical protein
VQKLSLTLMAGAALTLAACGDNRAGNNAAANATGPAMGATTGGSNAMGMGAGNGSTGAGASASSSWPEGARIVDEGGVTYRIDPGGARVRLAPNESRIVVENGVRYRVDPGGARVRIDQQGAVLRIGDSTIRGNAPNGRSDVETPGETASDAAEDAVEAVGDVVDPPRDRR